ncbi:ubiquitin carboxyl-terminal hydrolase MINDY-3 homolog [Atheta coriaria]|uniref:ubiquitin carboxyl-terminal hydrolase MINDY-3 homolog n=1 Tax=Dalotia coriaria TaxID=877792 RepID=UPI0031F3781E
MTTNATPSPLPAIRQLLWGAHIKADIFARWSQGFYFSKSESSALEQSQGGPCSILAPVQAYIIKNLLDEYKTLAFRDQIADKKQESLLLNALFEILRKQNVSASVTSLNETAAAEAHAPKQFYMAYLQLDGEGGSDAAINGEAKSTLNDVEFFHDAVRLRCINGEDECMQFMREMIQRYRAQYGILLFLYSVIATKGLHQLKSERSDDSSEPLIDETYGYGSQSLINLMITGRAVSYVWDHEQDVGGLKLRGIDHQSDIGFITLMEHMRYITVGTFYKSPKHPVWVLGSETHLTVLFSDNTALVSAETGCEQARRVFKNYDKDDNNFIKADDLQNVLADLQLVSETEYVNVMRRKLDSENLGIILLNAFMHEFYPLEERSTPDTFQLVHYNGLAQSNYDGQVKYRIGGAILLESDLRAMCESNPMLTCLQTKWPTIEVNWADNVTPSLN